MTQILVPRISDGAILNFLSELKEKYAFGQPSITIFGKNIDIKRDVEACSLVKNNNDYGITNFTAIRTFSANGGVQVQHCKISYTQNGEKQSSVTPNVIDINNQDNILDLNSIVGISHLINKHFQLSQIQNAAFQSAPDAFAGVLASHQKILAGFEENLAATGRELHEKILKIEAEKNDFVRTQQSEYDTRRQNLDREFAEKEAALAAREKEIDDRDNMHARRAQREQICTTLKDYGKKFSLTDNTRRMRWPIHVIIIASLLFICMYIYYLLPDHNNKMDYVIFVKTGFLALTALGLLTWYIRWMNRWFDRHAEAEFHLKQFGLDVDRANWVVETAMEWKAAKNDVIPPVLLEGISRNLFLSSDHQTDDNIHPADYLASAIFGKASHLSLDVNGNKVEFDRNAIKGLKK